MNYIKKEWKKLGSISLILIGSFLIIEHIYTYGGITIVDFLGHEFIGILLIVVGLIIANKKWNSKEDGTPFNHFKNKLKYIFKK